MFSVIVLLYYNQKTWQSDSSSVKDEIYVKISSITRTHYYVVLPLHKLPQNQSTNFLKKIEPVSVE